MRGRRAVAVAALELRTAFSGALLWALVGFALLAGTALNVTTFTSAGGAVRPFVNSQHAMAWLFAMSGFLVYGFFASILAGMATIRDDEHRVSELLHSSGLTRRSYLAGKLAGVLAALGLALALHLAGTVALVQLGPLEATLARGPFRWSSFLVPVALFPLPYLWFCAGLGFVVGERARRPMAVFAVPVVLFFTVSWLMAWAPAGMPAPLDRLLMVLDPSGLRWLLRSVLSVDRGVEFYNSSPLPVDATFTAGRLFVLLLPALAVAWTMVRRSARSRRRPRGGSGAAASPTPGGTALPGPLAMDSRPPGFGASVVQVARCELRELWRQPGLLVFVPLLMAVVWDAATSVRGPYGAALVPTAGRLAVDSLGAITLLACPVLLFYVVQSVQRDRTTGFAPLLHATPVPTPALLLGKGVAHGALVAALLLGCLAVAAPVLLTGGGRLDLLPLLLVWGGVLVPTLLLWITFVAALLALVRDRYATFALAVGALGLSLRHLAGDGASWLTNWMLLGTLRWSDLGGFALDGKALLLNRLLALALALVLAAVAVRAYPRREADAAALVGRLHPRRSWRSALALAALAWPALLLAGALAAGIRSGFQGEAAGWDTEDRRRTLTTWSGVELPRVTALDATVDLDPAARSAGVAGTFTVTNPTAEPMARLPFTVGPDLGEVRWWLDGTPAAAEERTGLHVLRPATPLAPGGEMRVGFAYRLVRPRGFTRNGGGVEQFILPSGVLLHTLRDSFLPLPPPGRGEAPGAGTAVPFDSRVEITAPAGVTVVAGGRKVRQHTRGDRTTVVWETSHPVRALSLAAGRWEERRRRGAAVYHHPGHQHNVETMLDTLVAARERYGAWFRPYPWRDLKISEFPDLATNALGFATHVPVSEGLGFRIAPDQAGHPVFLVVAHEAAHQWWGNLLAPAAGPGTGHLAEGMAHYSALRLLEAERGVEARRELARRMERNYQERRRRATERPLLEMGDGDSSSTWTVVYEKGAWVTWMLQEHLGREAFDAGLRGFFQRHADALDHPTTEDLLHHLRPHARDRAAYDGFVDRWFRRVVLPEYRISGVAVLPAGGGWRVSAEVANVGSGSVPVEVAVQGEVAVPGKAPSRRLRLHPEPGRPALLEVTVGFEPRRIVVDPDVEVLQQNRERAVAEGLVVSP